MKRMPTGIVAVAALATLTIGGCGTDQPPVCDSLAAVQTTMHQIRNTNVAENGLATLRTHLQQLRVDVGRLLDDAGTQFAPEVAAVRATAGRFATSVTEARETPDPAHLSTVRLSLGDLQTGVRSLGDAMSGTC